MRTFCLLLILLLSIGAHANELVLSEKGISGLNTGDNNLVSIREIKESFPGFTVSQREGYWEGPDYDSISVTDKFGKFMFEIISYRDEVKIVQKEEYPIHKVYLGDDILDEYGVKKGDKISKAVSLRKHDLKLIHNHHDNSIGRIKIYYKFTFPLTQEEIDAQRGVNWGFAPSIEEAINRDPIIENIVWINWP